LSKDTAQFADLLSRIRGKESLTSADYKSHHSKYLEWIDSRVKAGFSTLRMNRELKSAGLLKKPSASVAEDESTKYTGYLTEITNEVVHDPGLARFSHQ
jgi:hypothetical protein